MQCLCQEILRALQISICQGSFTVKTQHSTLKEKTAKRLAFNMWLFKSCLFLLIEFGFIYASSCPWWFRYDEVFLSAKLIASVCAEPSHTSSRNFSARHLDGFRNLWTINDRLVLTVHWISVRLYTWTLWQKTANNRQPVHNALRRAC